MKACSDVEWKRVIFTLVGHSHLYHGPHVTHDHGEGGGGWWFHQGTPNGFLGCSVLALPR